MSLLVYSINQKFIKMKNLQVNWKKLSHYLANQEKLYNEAPESYKDQIFDLLISYVASEDYNERIESFTSDPDKIDFIVIELSEYYHEFLNKDCEDIDNEYYIKNIFRILNN